MSDPREIEDFLKKYIPQDQLIPVNVNGFQNPINSAKMKYTDKLAENAAGMATDQQNTKDVFNSGFLKVLNNYIDPNSDDSVTLPQLEEALKTQQEYFKSPQNSANILKQILVPAMKDYDQANPPLPGGMDNLFQNAINGFMMKMVPSSMRNPQANTYFRRQEGLKSLIAKGLLGNVGNLTANEQQNPLELLPSDSDDPQTRINNIRDFLQLLNSFGSDKDSVQAPELNQFQSFQKFKNMAR